jgi:hypothetical protein
MIAYKSIKPKPVKHSSDTKRRNEFCGPAALSILMGITAEAAACRVRTFRRKWRTQTVFKARKHQAHGIVSVSHNEMISVLSASGYAAFNVDLKSPMNLSQFEKHRTVEQRRESMLVHVTGHYVVIKGDKLFDNHHPNGTVLSEYEKRRVRVRRVQIIKKRNIGE